MCGEILCNVVLSGTLLWRCLCRQERRLPSSLQHGEVLCKSDRSSFNEEVMHYSQPVLGNPTIQVSIARAKFLLSDPVSGFESDKNPLQLESGALVSVKYLAAASPCAEFNSRPSR